jgi:hypothetical protein
LVPHGNAPSQKILLTLVRFVWVIFVPLLVGLACIYFSMYIQMTQTICDGSACLSSQPNSGTVQALSKLGLSLQGFVWLVAILLVVSAIPWLVVAIIIGWKNFHNWFALSVSILGATQAAMDARPPDFLSSVPEVWQWIAVSLVGFTYTIYVVLGAFFPNGVTYPRWTRWIVGIWFLIGLPSFYLSAFPSPLPTIWADWLAYFVEYCWFGCVIGVCIGQVYRYRHLYTQIERQQTKWVVFFGVIAILEQTAGSILRLIFPALNDPGSLFIIFYFPVTRALLAFMAFSLLIAMLRYRLWDIDVLIHRTLVYGSLTAVLVGIYSGLVFAIETLLQEVGLLNQDSGIAIVVSTLTVAALFQPLRLRIQHMIDRRFYRSKYSAAQVLTAFSSNLRNEIDLKELSVQLMAVVDETMRPEHISLWVRSAPEHRQQSNEIGADSV